MIWNAGSFNIMYQKKHIMDDYITKMNCMKKLLVYGRKKTTTL